MAGVRHRVAHVGEAERAKPRQWVALVTGAGLHLGAEAAEALDGERAEERLAAGEVAVGRGVADPGAARQLAQRQRARPRLLDDAEGRVEERAPQIAVVITPLGLGHWFPSECHE